MLLVGRTYADVAGTGTFDISLNVGIPTTTFNGMIVFDAGTRSVLGQDVDLAADVGNMSYDGTAQVSLQSRSATFEFDAGPANEFAFHAAGAGACDATGCLNGQATFAGIFDSLDDPMDVVPDATYTFDGTIFVSFLGGGTGGTVAINAFPKKATDPGSDVLVESGPTDFHDVSQGVVRSFSATIRYPNVTSGGTTSFVAFSKQPGNIPDGYELLPDLSIFIDIFTSATFTGNADACVTVNDVDGDGFADGTPWPVAQLRLLHAAAAGQDFTDVTDATSPSGFLCGNVSSLSPFVVARDPSISGSTTTTTTPDGGTTTTTLPSLECSVPVACIDAALGTPLCGEEAINPKLQTAITTKLGKARTLIQTAETKPATKTPKFLARIRKQLAKIDTKADAFTRKKPAKGPITPGCAGAIHAVVDQIEAALDANPPVGTGGTGGSGGSGLRATIEGRPAFQSPGFFYPYFPLYVQGCKSSTDGGPCERVLNISVPNDPIGTPQVFEQPSEFDTYVYYQEVTPDGLAEESCASRAGTTVEILGLTGDRLQGRFAGTFGCFPSGVERAFAGTLNVPPGGGL
jgi:hypothetical protein